MRVCCLLGLVLCFCACKEEKTEFIPSKAINGFFLIKNPPQQDALLKKEIALFLTENPPQPGPDGCVIKFYKYTSNTKYFLDHKEDPGGFSSEELTNYRDKDGIALFTVDKCKNDTTKWVGELRFYNSKEYNFYKPDTIVYKCD